MPKIENVPQIAVDLDEPELKELANRISDLMGDFYQLVSLKSDEKFHGEENGN